MTTPRPSTDRPVALVTGASSGIGRAFAQRLAADGNDLVVVARRTERLEALKAQLESEHGVSVQPVVADLASEEGRNAVIAAARDPRLSTIIDNAALAHYMPFADLPEERVEELVRVNVLAPVQLIRAALPGMVQRGTGTVVSVASMLAFSSAADSQFMPKRAMYVATKSFLVTFIRQLAIEMRGTGLRVQVVCPPMVRTEFHSRQGIDTTGRALLEPEQVVQASMRGLELGEVVCMPTVGDATILSRHDQLETELFSGALSAELANRYSS
jgi:short-subunit dehydrogenase